MKLTTQDNLPALGTFVESSPMSDQMKIEIVLKFPLPLQGCRSLISQYRLGNVFHDSVHGYPSSEIDRVGLIPLDLAETRSIFRISYFLVPGTSYGVLSRLGLMQLILLINALTCIGGVVSHRIYHYHWNTTWNLMHRHLKRRDLGMSPRLEADSTSCLVPMRLLT